MSCNFWGERNIAAGKLKKDLATVQSKLHLIAHFLCLAINAELNTFIHGQRTCDSGSGPKQDQQN